MLKEIPNYSGYYASPEGKIYTTLKKGCRNRYDLSKRIAPQELKVRLLPTGYARIYLREETSNKRKDLYVHRIIAKLFIPNPNNLPEINHKDCNPLNNHYTNLEWVTHKENLEYGLIYGNRKRDSKGRFS